jgi:hypothetical protein
LSNVIPILKKFKDEHINQPLPPWALVKTWLDIIQQEEIPLLIRQKRLKMITYYFGLSKSAINYVEANDDYRQVA